MIAKAMTVSTPLRRLWVALAFVGLASQIVLPGQELAAQRHGAAVDPEFCLANRTSLPEGNEGAPAGHACCVLCQLPHASGGTPPPSIVVALPGEYAVRRSPAPAERVAMPHAASHKLARAPPAALRVRPSRPRHFTGGSVPTFAATTPMAGRALHAVEGRVSA